MKFARHWMMTAFWGLLVGFVPVSLANAPAKTTDIPCAASQKEGVLVDLTAQQGKELVRACAPLILDVRTPSEYEDGHIPEAKLIPLQELEKRIGELQPHRKKPVLIYCRSGNRSRVAAKILKRFGFDHLYHLNRGMMDWSRNGFPVHR